MINVLNRQQIATQRQHTRVYSSIRIEVVLKLMVDKYLEACVSQTEQSMTIISDITSNFAPIENGIVIGAMCSLFDGWQCPLFTGWNLHPFATTVTAFWKSPDKQ